MGKSKFYAVRKGRSVGIFTDWTTCQNSTARYPGAQFKSFPTREEAEAYLWAEAQQSQQPQQQQRAYGAAAGGTVATATTAPGSKFYAIAKGHRTGVFPGTWSDVKIFVEGFPGAVFKSFATQQEAEQYLGSMNSSNQGAPAAAGPSSSLAGSKRPFSDMDSRPPPPAFSEASQHPPAAAAAAGPGVVGVPQQQQQQQQGELQVTIFFDGGSRGNPGVAGYGYSIEDRQTGYNLRIGCRPLPRGSTNNQAEYSGMIEGMRFAADVLKARHVVVKGDSQLAVRQMTGEYRVTSDKMKPLYREAKALADRFTSFEIQHVYRDDNCRADSLSNIAMDSYEMVERLGMGQPVSRRAAAVDLMASCKLLDNAGQPVPEVLAELCCAESFTEAAVHYLSVLWDQEEDEVLNKLEELGWTELTGGPPEPPPPTAAAAGGLGRGQATVAVAAVSLGPQWADEIRRQEQLMQQAQGSNQQRPQQQQRQQQACQQMGLGQQILMQSQAHRRRGQQGPPQRQAQQQQQQQQVQMQQVQQQQQQVQQGHAGSSCGGGGNPARQLPYWPPKGPAGGRGGGSGAQLRQRSSSSSSSNRISPCLPMQSLGAQQQQQQHLLSGGHPQAALSWRGCQSSSSYIADLLHPAGAVRALGFQLVSTPHRTQRVRLLQPAPFPAAAADSGELCSVLRGHCHPRVPQVARAVGGPRMRAAAGLVAVAAAAAAGRERSRQRGRHAGRREYSWRAM